MVVESRTELQARISEPFGHTTYDREENIAFLLVQLQNDIATTRQACNTILNKFEKLKGFNGIHGSKARMRELRQCTDDGLNAIEHGCGQILALTKNKTFSLDAERRLAVLESNQRKLDKERKIGMEILKNPSSKPIPKQPNSNVSVEIGHKEVARIIERRKAVQNQIIQSKSKLQTTMLTKADINPSPSRIKQNTSTRPSQRLRKTGSVEKAVGASIILKDKTVVNLPSPQTDNLFYSMREMVLHLSPYYGQGLKRIAKDLYNRRRILFSPSTLLQHIQNYKSDPRKLPPEDEIVGKVGRPPAITTKVICAKLNKKEHDNISYIGDGIKDAVSCLNESRKRSAQEAGILTDDGSNIPTVSRNTVAAYDFFSTIMDPNISRVEKDSARIKSLTREVMSRSIRSLFCHIEYTLIKGFVVGKSTRNVGGKIAKVSCESVITM